MADKPKEPKEDPAAQAAEAQVAASEAEKAKVVEAVDKKSAYKPTPTQRECDLAALGHGVMEKEPDGSPPDVRDPITRAALEAQKPSGGGYQTREMPSAPRGAPQAPHRQPASSGST